MPNIAHSDLPGSGRPTHRVVEVCPVSAQTTAANPSAICDRHQREAKLLQESVVLRCGYPDFLVELNQLLVCRCQFNFFLAHRRANVARYVEVEAFVSNSVH